MQQSLSKLSGKGFYKVDSGEITGTGQVLLVWKYDGSQCHIEDEVRTPTLG
jgi:hypothetical protein